MPGEGGGGTSLPETGKGQELLIWVQDGRKTGQEPDRGSREEASLSSPAAGRSDNRIGPLLQAQKGL